MLFDRKRPQRSIARHYAEDAGKVRKKYDVQQKIGSSAPAQNELDQQQRIVNRKNAQGAAQVKAAEVVRIFLGVKQDSCDEKTRQNKKEIYPEPSTAAKLYKNLPRSRKMPLPIRPRKAVVIDDQQNCNASYRVQFGHDRTHQSAVRRQTIFSSHDETVRQAVRTCQSFKILISP